MMGEISASGAMSSPGTHTTDQETSGSVGRMSLTTPGCDVDVDVETLSGLLGLGLGLGLRLGFRVRVKD